MPHTSRPWPPRVFLSFAGADRRHAENLRQALEPRKIRTFLDRLDIRGTNIVLAINDALTESDYYVLLWSVHCRNHAWVEAEWTAALYQELAQQQLARQLAQRRSFLFVVRLDGHPLPTLLAARQYLEAQDGDWSSVAAELEALWRRDTGVGVRVLPEPSASADIAPGEGSSAEAGASPQRGPADEGGAIRDHRRPDEHEAVHGIYLCNDILQVAHLVMVPAVLSGRRLYRLTRERLALREEITALEGMVGLRFRYGLRRDGHVVDDDPATVVKVDEGDVIHLDVDVIPFGPAGNTSGWSISGSSGHDDGFRDDGFRDDGRVGTVTAELVRQLTVEAFGHLMPAEVRSLF